MKDQAKSPEPQKSKLDNHLDALEKMKAEAFELCSGICEVKDKLVKRANGAMSHFVGEVESPRKPPH